MKVLDIDLDFFLSEICHRPNRNSRLLSSDYIPWAPEAVHNFMEHNCALTRVSKLPALVVRTHDEVFDIWREQIRKRHLQVPFHVVHVDAHADLGFSDSSYIYILGELLQVAPNERQDPKRGGGNGLNQGNYLAFAIACRWLRKLTYVHHPRMSNDLPYLLFRNHQTQTKMIELGLYRVEDAERLASCNAPPQPLALEPPVPIHMISKEKFKNQGGFAFAYVSISPQYTPPQAEDLIQEIGRYVRFFDKETFLQIRKDK